MKLRELFENLTLNEALYDGYIGAMEAFRFERDKKLELYLYSQYQRYLKLHKNGLAKAVLNMFIAKHPKEGVTEQHDAIDAYIENNLKFDTEILELVNKKKELARDLKYASPERREKLNTKLLKIKKQLSNNKKAQWELFNAAAVEAYNRIEELKAETAARMKALDLDESANASKFKKNVQRAIPGMKNYQALDNNNNPYLAYRFGVALAGSPTMTSMSKTSPTGSDFVIIDYSEADNEIRKGAERMFGVKPTSDTGSHSEETDSVQKKSPVAKIKRNRYGI